MKLHSSSAWPASSTTGAKSSVRASLPWITERTCTPGILFAAAGDRDRVHVEQTSQLPSIRRCLGDAAERVLRVIRARVVVEEREGLLGPARELLQGRHPLLELCVGVEVVEAVGSRPAALVPRR